MFDVGVIASVGFAGAAIASRVRLPIIIGYIIAGILTGPNIHLRLLGGSYDGILSDSVFLQSISQLGLVLLLLFVGLEFSITKLMKTKEAAAILAATNLAVNFFAGFVIGAWLGWPVIDTIFMAGVIGMSSSAIAAKSLIDLKRLGNKETEFLLGMVILESFLAMFILTLANGMILPSETPVDVTGVFAAIRPADARHRGAADPVERPILDRLARLFHRFLRTGRHRHRDEHDRPERGSDPLCDGRSARH